MLLTKLRHSSVRLSKGDTTIVLDPGVFGVPADLDGAQAIFVTHEHVDHLDADRITAAARASGDLEVWAAPAVATALAALGDRVHAVGHGDAFTVGAVDVHVYGEKHARVHPDWDLVDNVGFLLDGELFHPGDALTVPEQSVGTLLAPLQAPWLKTPELVGYARAVGAPRAFAVHDGLLTDFALSIYAGVFEGLGRERDGDYRRLTPGDVVDLAT